jgi:hypothetical protein
MTFNPSGGNAVSDDRRQPCGPTHPGLTKNLMLAHQLRIADLTYGFVYLPAILDACSRAVIGCATSRSTDARAPAATPNAAIGGRTPAKAASTVPIEGHSMPQKPAARS